MRGERTERKEKKGDDRGERKGKTQRT